jgi:ribonuclease D|tara:strand:+ start:1306 stop:2472 length:1167 start_codon:yes stop_codon:yes gene_type:complete
MDSELIDTEVVDDQAGLISIVEELSNSDIYAIDTEFHREKTYFAKLALIQLRWSDRLAIIDPLNLDLSVLSKIFHSNSVAVFHAGSQDLEILHRAAGAVPRSIFDTQIAAGFLGMRTPSLSSLHENLLGLKLTKGDRLTDWLQRPLKESQLQYAASDVRYLLELHQVLTERLIKLKRYEWAEAEFVTFLEKRQKLIDPKDAWQRIKEAKHLNKQARGVAQALAEWRELAAQKNDIPNRYIMSDLALVGIAQRKPTKLSDLKNIRGFDYAQYQKEKGQHLLKIVEKGLKADPVPSLKSRKKSLPPEMRPAVTLLSAWLSQFATDQNIDPALLGSRSDIEELLRGESDSRLQVGWRHEEVGEQVDNLLKGKSSLSFENGRLVIESRGTLA